LSVGQNSATAGRRIRRILKGDLADRSACDQVSSLKRPGFFVQHPRKALATEAVAFAITTVAGESDLMGSDRFDPLFPSNPSSPSLHLSATAFVNSEPDA